MKCMLFITEAEMDQLGQQLGIASGNVPRFIERAAYEAGVILPLQGPEGRDDLRPIEALEVVCVD